MESSFIRHGIKKKSISKWWYNNTLKQKVKCFQCTKPFLHEAAGFRPKHLLYQSSQFSPSILAVRKNINHLLSSMFVPTESAWDCAVWQRKHLKHWVRVSPKQGRAQPSLDTNPKTEEEPSHPVCLRCSPVTICLPVTLLKVSGMI